MSIFVGFLIIQKGSLVVVLLYKTAESAFLVFCWFYLEL